jgi:hypothetical protein
MVVRYANGVSGPIDIALCEACDALPSLELDKIARALEASWLQEMTDAGSAQAEIEASKAGWPITLEEKAGRQQL